MSAKRTDNTLKVLTLILALSVIGLGIYTVKIYKEREESIAQFKNEKVLMMDEINEEIARYNAVIKENTSLSDQLIDSKEKLEGLQKQLTENNFSRAVMQEYRVELRKLRREREVLFKKNDSLTRETERLAYLNQQTQQALEVSTQQQDSLKQENVTLSDRVALGSLVSASNLRVRGVIQRNSGKLVTTQRARRAEMIHVCYDVNKNSLAPAGDLPFYTQVKDTNGRILGSNREVTLSDGSILKYSNRTIVPYKNEDFGVCELVIPLQKNQLDAKAFTINIFQEDRLLLSAPLTLK